ncbi:MAG: mevalonate kinase [Limisphaerales bacterium]|jgi:mevalonate kinase
MNFSAHGKLLLTGEYLVMHGGLALAMPVSRGQHMEVELIEETQINWLGFDHKGDLWLEASFSTKDFSIINGEEETASVLKELFSSIREQKPDFLNKGGAQIETTLDFPRDWGLGSSSTLVSLLAQWADVDPFKLQFNVFGGSAYDIACATASGPIMYKLVEGNPVFEEVVFDPPFKDKLWFVHLGRKQNSRDSIKKIDLDPATSKPWLTTLVHLTVQLRFCAKLSDFEQHLKKHEEVLGALTGQTPVLLADFPDYPGQIKSLGAWGGDFVLATGEEEAVKSYFEKKGLNTVLSWVEMTGN